MPASDELKKSIEQLMSELSDFHSKAMASSSLPAGANPICSYELHGEVVSIATRETPPVINSAIATLFENSGVKLTNKKTAGSYFSAEIPIAALTAENIGRLAQRIGSSEIPVGHAANVLRVVEGGQRAV
jgi:hypothetical protein